MEFHVEVPERENSLYRYQYSFCPRSCGSAARFGFDAAVFPAGLVQIPDGQLQGFSCVPYEQ